MYLNILDFIDLELRGDGPKLKNYLKHEYPIFQTSRNKSPNPDIVIEIERDISSKEESVHIRGPVGFDDDGVFFHHNLPGEEPLYNAFRIDFDSVGKSTCYASCDPDFNTRFFGILVDYLIHFHLLEYNATYCHSCAFEIEGNTVVCPAWRRVGKTNLLLEFLKDEAKYIADDWCVLQSDGTAYPLPKRLNLLYYNFEQNPGLLEETGEEFRSLVEFVRRAKEGEYDLNQEAIDTLTNQARMRISPYDLFPEVLDNQPVSVDYIFLLQQTPSSNGDLDIIEMEPNSFPHRKQSILEFEQTYFHMGYRFYKSHTGSINQYLESTNSKALDILSKSVNNIPKTYEINVPSQESADKVRRLILDRIKNGK